MELDFDDAFLCEVVSAEAEARGLRGDLIALSANKEADGLDTIGALLDAADVLGLVAAVRTRLDEVVSPLAELEVIRVGLGDAHGGMPSCSRIDGLARLTVQPAPLDEMCAVLRDLCDKARNHPEHTNVILPIGLGGTGGCACGEDLPEDAPPGPLFERR
jgi:hypothetical protein